MKSEVASEVDEAAIVDDTLGAPLAGDDSRHPIVENLAWHAANRIKSDAMATQHRRQVLVQDEPCQISRL
ncbi:hypothetical protein GCM10028812_25660 [Ancylobacter sonchi]